MNHARHQLAPFESDGRRLDLHPMQLLPSWGGPGSSRLQLAALVFLAWTAVGIFQFVPDMLAGFHWPVFVAKMIDAWAWALVTPAVLLADRKLAATERNAAHLILIFLLLSIPFSIGHTYLTGLLAYPVEEIWWSPIRNKDYVIHFLTGSWQTFCAIVGILQALRYYNRFLTSRLQLERVEKTLIEARLNALRLQVEPHFLFNALNAISSEVSTDQTLAREMIEDLGALLRGSLDCKERTEIRLAQELALLEHYLSIQRVRFGERLDIEIDVDTDALVMMVPSMLLQPLVDNAIRHGIEGRMSGGTIVVSAHRSDDHLEIRVLDDGLGLPRNWRLDGSAGLGLRVTRERLEALYPEVGEDSFAIRRRESGGTEVAIRIPLHRTANGLHETA